eukprot:TRINITY_DN95749_c0_g1_i1.p1 TRINITY_DN95749_c0_g1~~TRINITY_DN95749_c0_g1_i1.p1  ORF type:complete len:384 (+),score=87.81 TRINITY_DN95749_c0_g1_i1:145-1152(+)
MTPCPFEKSRKTRLASEMWNKGSLPVTCGLPGDLVPDSPARPSDVSVVSKGKVKSGSMKAMLHGVCHAESYAIDLMWDSVARFAENDGEGGSLPREFFDDWVRIASDEARHFCGWAKHLEDKYATRYGDLPTHEMLWEVAAATKHSLRARLAVVHLIHEARGLDVAPTMRAKCVRSQDLGAAEMLDRNIKDEVTHVGGGARWFRYLCKEKAVADPCAEFQRLARAFGLKHGNADTGLKRPFNTELRIQADLPESWYLPLAEKEAECDSDTISGCKGAGACGANGVSSATGACGASGATGATGVSSGCGGGGGGEERRHHLLTGICGCCWSRPKEA